MIRILAISNSDSYLKWSAAILQRIVAQCNDADVSTTHELVLIKGPITPSERQITTALAGTTDTRPRVLSFPDLRRRVRDLKPDVVLMGCTGPVGEMIACAISRDLPRQQRPVFLSGMPGIHLVPKRKGATWRRWTDGFIVHSPAEIGPNRDSFAECGANPSILLTELPFLRFADDPSAGATAVSTIVFATQALPLERDDRVSILASLARAASQGFRVVVKLRALKGEGQTHREELPYDELWNDVYPELGCDPGLLEFRAGAMADWLFPGAALVTVSSTAGLEALALGRPTVFLSDFGIDQHALHNSVYAESGCLVHSTELAQVLRAGGPKPEAEWLKSHYLHGRRDELGAEVIRLVERRRRGEDRVPARIYPAGIITYAESRLAAKSPRSARTIVNIGRGIRRITPPPIRAAIGRFRRSLWARDLRLSNEAAKQRVS